ncbi:MULTISPECIES: helix-turn-helix domain-containing protein [unclassified Mammaliicoccus]|uniref:helix-turn-helix domain-containing protein n=1 Tax=Mammaliicoccus TaxID=2803850 RepID=UPI001EFAB51D|nr:MULTISPECIES: helix-turn-helix domain-containing protein [unclassified Mammaliicoccus]
MNRHRIEPIKTNTVTNENQIVFLPIYSKIATLADLCNVSKSTIYRIIDRYDKEPNGVEDMYISLSATLKLVEIEKFKEYLRTINKSWM